MINPTSIRKHMEVFSAAKEKLGTVDGVHDDQLKLTRDVVGQHHFIPLKWVTTVDTRVHLSRPARDAERLWAGEKFE